MPIRFVGFREQVRSFVLTAKQRLAAAAAQRNQLFDFLLTHNSRLEATSKTLSSFVAVDSGIRCAFPHQEPWATSYLPEQRDHAPSAVAVVGVDGSQIIPDRHLGINFALINLGALSLGAGNPPTEHIQTHLFIEEEQGEVLGEVSEDVINLRRDVAERQFLVEIAETIDGQIVGLFDGPIELYREPRADPVLRSFFDTYLASLSSLAEMQVALAGYTESPFGSPVIQSLELLSLDHSYHGRPRFHHPFSQVRDTDLFGCLLSPGARSAVFQLHSSATKFYKDHLELHFFYLNVGRSGRPQIARVEVPRWVVEEPGMLETLHLTLLQQCRPFGDLPYPYVLTRAHEIAVIRQEDRAEIQQLIAQELYRNGMTPPSMSIKQRHKGLLG